MMAGCSENEKFFNPNDFSDISFINSQIVNKWSTHIIEKGNPISFMDLSQNALSHSWTIDEGCCFIRGEYNRTDSVFDQYIIPDAGNVSYENTVYVLFQEPGNKTVRLTNTFSNRVVYNGLSESGQNQQTFPGDAVKESYYDEEKGVWVFDTLMHFKVLDYVTADMVVKRNNEEILKVSRDDNHTIDNSSEWDKITMEVGDEITVSADIYGEPDENLWKLNTALIEVETNNEIISENPLVTRMTSVFSASKLAEGNFGYMMMERKGKVEGSGEAHKPASKQSKYFPLNLEIVAPTSPFVIEKCNVLDFTEIQLSYKSTIKMDDTLLKEYLDCFSVTVGNENINISEILLNETSDALILTLQDPVYADDDIKVNYKANPDNPIIDIYGRKLEDAVDMKPEFFNPVITDPISRGFEGEIINDKKIFGWFIQHFPVVSVNTDVVYGGNRSLMYDSSKGKEGDNYGAGVTCQSTAENSELSGPAGDYIVEAWVYIKGLQNSNISKITFGFQFPGVTTVIDEKELKLDGLHKDQWIKVTAKYGFSEPLIPGKTKLNIQFPLINSKLQQGVVYVDDIKMYRVVERP